MSRRFLAVGLLLLAPVLRGAQVVPEYPITAEEEAAFGFTQSPPQFVKAREAAEAILARQPDSFVALYVLGYVYEWGEANLPRARFFSSRGRAVHREALGRGHPDRRALALARPHPAAAHLDLPPDGPGRRRRCGCWRSATASTTPI